MSELDNESPMSREQFKKKYIDTHTAIQGHSLLTGGYKNLIDKHPGDKNVKHYVKLKKPIELKCAVKRAENLQNFLLDIIEVRAEDALDKKQLPFKDALKIAVSAMPKKLDINANVTNTFAELWNTMDVEGEVVD
jgi:hypothetical protein